MRDSYGRVIDKIATQVDHYVKLLLSLASRIGLVKMMLLPQLLYLFMNVPLRLPKVTLQRIRGLVTRLVWVGGHPRIWWEALTLPYDQGVFSAPDF